MKNILYLLVFISALAYQSAGAAENWKYVRPETGAAGEGNVFPGVCVPFGMVKLGADCGDLGANQGWKPDGPVMGFSHTHVSGTGGGPKYGNVLVQPVAGHIDPENYASERSGETFALNCYGVRLDRYDVGVRLTATDKVGVHEYTFAATDTAAILFDAGSHLRINHQESQRLVASGIKINSDTELEGFTTVAGGWNMGSPYTVYFYARADRAADSVMLWKDGKTAGSREVRGDNGEKAVGAFVYSLPEGGTVNLKVGISFVSTEKARQNLNAVGDLTFDAIRQSGIDKWNEVLDRVTVEGSEQDKMLFYTCLHHACLQPTDRTGENPLWLSDEPYYDDYYAIWDTFRATHPLLTLILPSRQTGMVQSAIDIWAHEGYLPDGRSGNCNGRVQGGSNCDVMIADAYVKGLVGIDYEKGLRAMLTDAETEPADARKEGRGGTLMSNRIGFMPLEIERSGTRTYENAYCDYAIATLAHGLGRDAVADIYYRRSSNWQNLWNDSIESLGHRGFLWPRRADGSWAGAGEYNVFWRQDWEGVCYESTSWEMSFYVPHDVAALIERCGGPDSFIKRLDTYFTYDKVTDQRYCMGLFQVSNEPGFLVPMLYNYVNRPDKTAAITRRVLSTRYRNAPDGLPGNDDSGSMSAWYVFQAMGFYPNAGQDVYLITSPVFENVRISMEGGKMFEIKATGASPDNIYVQSARLNCVDLDRCWLSHREIISGGRLELVMGDSPSEWALNGNLPPSLSTK